MTNPAIQPWLDSVVAAYSVPCPQCENLPRNPPFVSVVCDCNVGRIHPYKDAQDWLEKHPEKGERLHRRYSYLIAAEDKWEDDGCVPVLTPLQQLDMIEECLGTHWHRTYQYNMDANHRKLESYHILYWASNALGGVEMRSDTAEGLVEAIWREETKDDGVS